MVENGHRFCRMWITGKEASRDADMLVVGLLTVMNGEKERRAWL